MKRLTLRSLLAFAVLGASMWSSVCSSSAESPPVDDPIITQTVVHTNPDGTYRTTERQMRQSEATRQLQEWLAEAERSKSGSDTLGTQVQAIHSDVGCNFGDLLLFSGTSLSGNELCLAQDGTSCQGVSLSSFSYPGGGTWSGKIRSMFVWTAPAEFVGSPECLQCYASNAHEFDTVPSCVQNAVTVDMYCSC